MSSRYHLVEPLPVPSKGQHFMHTSRGGAGNITHLPPPNAIRTSGPMNAITFPISSNHRLQHSHHPPSPSNSSRWISTPTGRGGAGNIHTHSLPAPIPQHPRERAMFALDEELEAQLRRSRTSPMAPVYHVGRGGAGNILRSNTTPMMDRRAMNVDPRVEQGYGDGGGTDGYGMGTELRRKDSETDSSASERSARGAESGADVVNRGLRKLGAKVLNWGGN